MKKFKKGIIYLLKNFGSKQSKKRKKFSNMVLNLSLRKIDSDSLKFDGKAVYTADMSTLIYVFNTDNDFTIPDGVEIIGKMAFRQKRHMKRVVIPASVKVIENEAFYGCDELDDVVIPATVESVKAYAFADCYCLHHVTFEGNLKRLSRHAFDNCDNLHCIVVPIGSAKTYRKTLHIKKDNVDIVVLEEKIKDTPEAKVAETVKITEPKGNTEVSKSAISKSATS